MQTSNRFFDDLAKVASGAASTFVGLKQEIDAMVRQRVERLVADLDLVRRDEFEAVQALAANARTEQEKLERRLAELEAKLAGSGAPAGDAAAGQGAGSDGT
jgi:BMFP domain-containing protein YqiC